MVITTRLGVLSDVTNQPILTESWFTAITKGHSLEECRKSLETKQKSAARKSAKASVKVLRYPLAEVRESFELMHRKNLAKGATFEENLELVYLWQGFDRQVNAQGIEWLVKK